MTTINTWYRQALLHHLWIVCDFSVFVYTRTVPTDIRTGGPTNR